MKAGMKRNEMMVHRVRSVNKVNRAAIFRLRLQSPVREHWQIYPFFPLFRAGLCVVSRNRQIVIVPQVSVAILAASPVGIAALPTAFAQSYDCGSVNVFVEKKSDFA